MPQSNDSELLARLRASKILLLAGIFILIVLVVLALGSPDRARDSESQPASAASSQSAFSGVEILGRAAVVIDLSTGETLYEKNASAQLPLASLAKAALAIVISETMSPQTVITVPHYIESSTGPENLTTGERWRIQDILDFTLITSSNGGAAALAAAANIPVQEKYPAAPPESATLWRMNALAQELNLSETFFLNVSGLDESETLSGAYGSARDVAKLFAYASEQYSAAFARTAQNDIRLASPNGAQRTIVYNTNDVLGAVPGLILGKTGLTDLAGGNLAVVFDVGIAHPVVAVVLGSTKEGRFRDIELLVDRTRAHITNAGE